MFRTHLIDQYYSYKKPHYFDFQISMTENIFQQTSDELPGGWAPPEFILSWSAFIFYVLNCQIIHISNFWKHVYIAVRDICQKSAVIKMKMRGTRRAAIRKLVAQKHLRNNKFLNISKHLSSTRTRTIENTTSLYVTKSFLYPKSGEFWYNSRKYRGWFCNKHSKSVMAPTMADREGGLLKTVLNKYLDAKVTKK